MTVGGGGQRFHPFDPQSDFFRRGARGENENFFDVTGRGFESNFDTRIDLAEGDGGRGGKTSPPAGGIATGEIRNCRRRRGWGLKLKRQRGLAKGVVVGSGGGGGRGSGSSGRSGSSGGSGRSGGRCKIDGATGRIEQGFSQGQNAGGSRGGAGGSSEHGGSRRGGSDGGINVGGGSCLRWLQGAVAGVY